HAALLLGCVYGGRSFPSPLRLQGVPLLLKPSPHSFILFISGLELLDPLRALLLIILGLLDLAKLLGSGTVLAVVHSSSAYSHYGEALGKDTGSEHALSTGRGSAADGAERVDKGPAGESGT